MTYLIYIMTVITLFLDFFNSIFTFGSTIGKLLKSNKEVKSVFDSFQFSKNQNFHNCTFNHCALN